MARRYSLRLTEEGMATLQSIGGIAREHQQKLLATLSEEERRQLAISVAACGKRARVGERCASELWGMPQQNVKHLRRPQ
jgi:hypothetical protein